jgi:hypothetical protein
VYQDFHNTHVIDTIEVQNVSVIPHTETTADHYLVQFQLQIEADESNGTNSSNHKVKTILGSFRMLTLKI